MHSVYSGISLNPSLQLRNQQKPRRIAATSIAQRVAEEMRVTLGHQVLAFLLTVPMKLENRWVIMFDLMIKATMKPPW